MIKLKEIKHYPDTNSVEATWVEVIEPERIITEYDPDDPVVVISEQIIPAVERQVKCHSYADVQMDMLESDLGADAAGYTDLIATVRANIKPPVPPSVAEQKAAIDAQRDEQLRQGFTFNGNIYHCDEIFQSQVQAYLLAWQTGILPVDALVSIRRKDNVTEQMTKAQVAALGAALMAHVQGIYAASWAAKDAL